MGRGRDGVRESMATGPVIYVLSRGIAGNSTSPAKAWSSRSPGALSREKIWAKEQRIARTGAEYRRERMRDFGEKIERYVAITERSPPAVSNEGENEGWSGRRRRRWC